LVVTRGKRIARRKPTASGAAASYDGEVERTWSMPARSSKSHPPIDANMLLV
jgi:hypothetical protein